MCYKNEYELTAELVKYLETCYNDTRIDTALNAHELYVMYLGAEGVIESLEILEEANAKTISSITKRIRRKLARAMTEYDKRKNN